MPQIDLSTYLKQENDPTSLIVVKKNLPIFGTMRKVPIDISDYVHERMDKVNLEVKTLAPQNPSLAIHETPVTSTKEEFHFKLFLKGKDYIAYKAFCDEAEPVDFLFSLKDGTEVSLSPASQVALHPEKEYVIFFTDKNQELDTFLKKKFSLEIAGIFLFSE